MTNPAGAEGSFAGDVMKQFAERLAEREDFTEVVGVEVEARTCRIGAFAADLNDANDLAIEQNGRTDHLLNGFGSLPGDFDSFEDGGVLRGGKIILDLGPAIAGGACREGGIAGKRNK